MTQDQFISVSKSPDSETFKTKTKQNNTTNAVTALDATRCMMFTQLTAAVSQGFVGSIWWSQIGELQNHAILSRKSFGFRYKSDEQELSSCAPLRA